MSVSGGRLEVVPAGSGSEAASPPVGRPLRGRLGLRSLRQREAATAAVFLAPQLLGFGLFVAGPVLAILWFGFFDWNILSGKLDFIGLANYVRLFESSEVARVARTTILFGLGFVPLTVGLGLILALAVNTRSRVSYLLRSAYFLPLVISLAAWTIVWRLMLQSNGPLNGILQATFGVEPIAWLRDETFALVAAIGVQVLKSIGYAMILFLAALQTVPSDLREAARIDGANGWQSFWGVTWPLIAPFTFMVTILLTIASFKSFALIYLLTNGGPGDATTVLSFYIYERGLRLFEMGYASALATSMFLAVLALTVVQFLLRRRWVYEGD